MIEYFDVTPELSNDMAIWPGLPPTRISKFQRQADGDPINVSKAEFCVHVGAHVDAAFHHYADGARTQDIPVQRLLGPAYVVDATHRERQVEVEDVEKACKLGDVRILLLKTRNSTRMTPWSQFNENYIFIAIEAARLIVERGIVTVGIDCLSVEDYRSTTFPVHRTLLKQNRVTILEGLDLRGIEKGWYILSALPVRFTDVDGAPGRVVLVRDSENRLVDTWNGIDR